MTQATQVKHPWRAVARTGLAMLLGVASLLPEILGELHLNGTVLGGQAIVVGLSITRVLTLPAVEAFLHRFAPWLAAQPKPETPELPSAPLDPGEVTAGWATPTEQALAQRWPQPEPSPLLRQQRTAGRHRPESD